MTDPVAPGEDAGSDPNAGLVKICVALPEPVSSLQREWLWAEPRGNGLFEVGNIPFLAYNLHIGDVVRCIPDPNGALQVAAVVERSGAETLRVNFAATAADEEFSDFFRLVEARDGLIESHDRQFRAVAMRSLPDYHAVAAHLEELQRSGVVEWFESGYQPDEPFADEP